DLVPNQLVVFVWLGSPKRNELPRYWVAAKTDVGALCAAHQAHGTSNGERRFSLEDLPASWENHWELFAAFLPDA
ncbi:MAG: hypothetical protein ABIO45_13980, partial [Burkholderiaceae bacterium]